MRTAKACWRKWACHGQNEPRWCLFMMFEPGVSLSVDDVTGLFFPEPSTFWAASRLEKLEALGLVVAVGDRYYLQEPAQMSAATRALHDQLAAENGFDP